MPAVTLVAVALAGLLLCRAGAADGADQLGDQAALEAQGQHDDDGAEERELGDRLGLRPA